MDTEKFRRLFKKYRLRSEFSTLSELSLAMAEKGLSYEESIFSHWQKGTRIPQSRNILIKLIEIFVEHDGITTVNEANEFLFSANQGYLSEAEISKIAKLHHIIFQAPQEIEDFWGREEIIQSFKKYENIRGKIILIQGLAGVGKTALAIKLCHLLKDKYKDGVFWYKVEENNITDILFSIAKILGEDISNINDLQVRATVVRSLIASKNLLLILDSAELSPSSHLLLSNSEKSTTITTSQAVHLNTSIKYLNIRLDPFTDAEALIFFRQVLKDSYSKVSEPNLLKIANKNGNLPVVLRGIADDILSSDNLLEKMREIENSPNLLNHEFFYDNKSLSHAISRTYTQLDYPTKSVLLCTAIFKGKDFSPESVAHIIGFSLSETSRLLYALVGISLVQEISKNIYKIHPVIQSYIQKKLNNSRLSKLTVLTWVLFVSLCGWWVFDLTVLGSGHKRVLGDFASVYFIMAVWGGAWGVLTSIKWGVRKSLMGKAILMFSLGLFALAFGECVYAFYTFYLGIRVPYPSWGDLGYFGSTCFYIYGTLLLARVSGISIRLKSFSHQFLAAFIPLGMLTSAYYLFMQNYIFDFSDPIKLFLDFAYPLSQAIYISIALLTYFLSKGVLGGIMKGKVLFILFALSIEFLSDYYFLYHVSHGTWITGGFGNLLYLCAFFLMASALMNLRLLHFSFSQKKNHEDL